MLAYLGWVTGKKLLNLIVILILFMIGIPELKLDILEFLLVARETQPDLLKVGVVPLYLSIVAIHWLELSRVYRCGFQIRLEYSYSADREIRLVIRLMRLERDEKVDGRRRRGLQLGEKVILL